MAVAIVKERWTGGVAEIIIGNGPGAVKAGGETTLPFICNEGEMPNRPVLALEVWDLEPADWPGVLTDCYAGVLGDPAAWAQKCVDYGADLVCLRLMSTHPDYRDATPREAAETAKAVAEAVNVPLIVTGSGVEEKDAEVLPEVCAALAGRNALIGCATANNYKTLTAACLAHGHSIVASTPLDINLSKQLNILISEMNLPVNRIAMDPLVGPLGYGLEYAYSIMERTRLGALTGDKMLAAPVICFIGMEAWKTKEAKAEDSEEWGEQARRAVLWESVTAASLLQAGGSILVLRHPESLSQCRVHLAALSGTE